LLAVSCGSMARCLPWIYVPVAQDLSDDIYLVVRPTSGRADALTPSVRAAIGRVDKEQLVSVREVTTLEDIAWEATAASRRARPIRPLVVALDLHGHPGTVGARARRAAWARHGVCHRSAGTPVRQLLKPSRRKTCLTRNFGVRRCLAFAAHAMPSRRTGSKFVQLLRRRRAPRPPLGCQH
jgi:hypothetical protein